MKSRFVAVLLLVAVAHLGGCMQERETSGIDACKNNGGVRGGFSAHGGGTRVLWLCNDGSVRWSDKAHN